MSENETKKIQLEGHPVAVGRRITIESTVQFLDIPSKEGRVTFRPTGKFIEPGIEIWSCKEEPTGGYLDHNGLPITSFCGIPIVPIKDSEIKGDVTLVDYDEVFPVQKKEETLDRIKNEAIGKIMEQREEILSAFIAKYGCQPDEIEQVTTINPNAIQWTVRKKDGK